MTLPRTTEGYVGGRVKFYVGRIVYVSFSRDGSLIGFAFPKDQREFLVGGSPEKFMLPQGGDLRYHWVLARMEAIDEKEMRELVIDAWRMVVPKGVGASITEPGEAVQPTPISRAKKTSRLVAKAPAHSG